MADTAPKTDTTVSSTTGKVWASLKEIRTDIASVPTNWFYRFASNRPEDILKFGGAKNSTLLFRVSAVLQALEDRLYMRIAPSEQQSI